MKKSLLLITMFVCLAMNAQTIEIDGKNADWANIPMLNEPGVSPIFKMIVPQTGLTLPTNAAYCVMVERTAAQKATHGGYPVVYVDADQNKATKKASIDPWYCPAFGPEYEMATWDTGNTFGANTDETIHEMCVVKSNFDSVPFPFKGSFNAWLLLNNWAKLLPNDPDANGWLWDESTYHPIIVKPFTFADLNGTLAASATYSTHEALAPGASLDMTNGYANAVKLWASWAVELKTPAKYTIKANITGTNTASIDLKLVNLATNAVVASFASEDLVAGAIVEVGEWDLSAVPAGKYMLKFSNHVEWSDMKLNSLTLAQKGGTGIDNTAVDAQATKLIRDGQLVIIRNGVEYNAAGQMK